LTWIGRTDSGVVRQRLYDRDIGTLLLSPLDPGRKPWLTAIRKEGASTGFYIDPHWFGLAADGKALAFRTLCDNFCIELLPGEMLMLDLELVSKDYVTRLIAGSPGNRGLLGSGRAGMPGTQADKLVTYTNMPFQNGTVVPSGLLEAYGVGWWPQLYYGDMSPADTAAVCLEIARWNYPASEIHPFYDGKLIASDQRDGGWFTAERIPGVFSPTSWMAALLRKDFAPVSKESLRTYYTALAAA
jgi:hypothetical protein